MPVNTNLPWLPSSDQFLRAITAGAELGESRARRMDAVSQPRFGGGGVRFNFPDPLDAARIAALNSKQQRDEAEFQMANDAFASQADLLRRGATAQEAFEQSGVARFGVNQPRFSNPWQTLNLGSGEVARVNEMTGQLETIQPRRTEDEVTMSVPIFPPGVNPMVAQALGMQPTTVRGPISQVTPIVGTNAPSFGQSPAQFPTPTAARVRVKSPDGRVGTISESNLDEALRNGFTRVE